MTGKQEQVSATDRGRKIALFDLDDTLLLGDSDSSWNQFLVQRGYVDGDNFARRSATFHEDYKAERLDIHAYFEFTTTPVREHGIEAMRALQPAFIEEVIRPMVTQQALDLVASHADKTRILTSATNTFVITPIAELFDVDIVIGTDPEMKDGEPTGRILGQPNYRDGKRLRLLDWLAQQPVQPDETWGYSDSINDLPLLEYVDHPHAVNADPKLARIAELRGWPTLDFRAAAGTG